MQIIVHTTQGTFLVPPDKEAALIVWLEGNAVRAGQTSVREQTNDSTYPGRQLINEDQYAS
jgi:hypothetical protein